MLLQPDDWLTKRFTCAMLCGVPAITIYALQVSPSAGVSLQYSLWAYEHTLGALHAVVHMRDI